MGPEGVLTLSWLIRLRWAALAIYAGLLLGVRVLVGLELPWLLCGSLLLVVASTNLGLQAWWDAEGPGPRALTGLVLALDVLVFGGLLYATGGPANPCSALFLVHVALAASALGTGWGWAMALLASATYALLFRWHLPLGHFDQMMAGMDWHLGGMWAALSVAGGLVAHFVGRLSEALGVQRARADREARLAAVTALAAGAAHELATPLGTILVAAGDLDPADPAAVAEDVALIRREVARCRGILDALAHEGGQLVGETAQLLTLPADWAAVAPYLDPAVAVDLEPLGLRVPPRAFAMVVRALVKNAREAAGLEAPIQLHVRRTSDGGAEVRVVDPGPGFPPGGPEPGREPFSSTKGEAGLGLGLFLARGFAERLGGRLEIRSAPGRTEVALSFPAAVVA